MNILRVSVDRKTGAEIDNKIIGQVEVANALLGEGCVKLLTGMSVKESYEAVVKEA